MKNLFNNQWFIAMLAICAALLLARSIVVPLMGSTDVVAAGPEVEFYDEALLDDEIVDGRPGDGPLDGLPVSDGDAADALRILEPARTSRSVLNRQLTWNWHPSRDPFSALSDNVRDGGASVANQTPIPDGLPRLGALVAGPSSLLAVLGDQVVAEGDRVGDYLVTSIQRDGVQVRTATGNIWIPLSQDR